MRRHPLHRHQSGMSLVELLVATVISLLGVLIIFQVFAVNEDVRRTTTSGSDEQTSGLMGLMALERELRHAGFGVNDFSKTAPLPLLGCKMRIYDDARTPKLNTGDEFPLAPVEIVQNNGTVPDVVRVIYGGTKHTSTGVQIFKVEKPTEPVQLAYRYGFNLGDVVVIGQNGGLCTLMEVTGPAAELANDADNSGGTTLEHGNAAYEFDTGSDTTSKTPRFNDPNGFPQDYVYPLAKVLNLGPFPVYAEITVRNTEANPRDNNQLVVQNLWGETASPLPVAEQIVHLKAEYGMDDGKDCNETVERDVCVADDNLVDRFTGESPDKEKPEEWSRVRSVRLAIVSRSLTADRAPCSATPAYSADLNSDTYPVRWARGPDAPLGRPIDVSTTADWQCYRYRVYETTVPLRNMLWRQQ